MSEFNIKKDKVKPAVSALQAEARSVLNVSMTVADIRNCLAFQGSASSNVRLSLKSIVDKTAEEAGKLNGMGSALDSILSAYEKAEVKVVDHAKGRRTIGIGAYIWESISEHPALPWVVGGITTVNPVLGTTIGTVSAIQCLRNWWNDETISHWGLEDKGWELTDKSYSGKVDLSKIKGKNGKDTWIGKKLDDFDKKYNPSMLKNRAGQVDGGRGKYIYRKGEGFKEVMTQAEKDEFDQLTKNDIFEGVDVTIASVGAEKKLSVWSTPEDQGIIGDKDGTHASGQVRVLNFDREASAYIGLASMGATAGFSFSALHLEGEAQVGNEYNGLYAKGEIDALKAGAQVDASIGLLDKDGKVNPNLHLGGKAELLGGEASAKIGGRVAGVDVGAKVGVNYGIGAHADVGLKNGKFTLDVGATLGVGASIKVEVDVSKAVDTVCGAAVSAIDTIGDVGGSIISGIGGFFGF